MTETALPLHMFQVSRAQFTDGTYPAAWRGQRREVVEEGLQVCVARRGFFAPLLSFSVGMDTTSMARGNEVRGVLVTSSLVARLLVRTGKNGHNQESFFVGEVEHHAVQRYSIF